MSFFWSTLRDGLDDFGPLSPIAAGTLGASLLLSIALFFATLFARKNPSSPAVRKLSALVLVTFASGALLASRIIAESHRVLVERQQPAGLMITYSTWTWGMDTAEWAWLLLGFALTLIALFSGLAALLRARHLRRPLATVLLCSAALALATGVGLLYRVYEGRIPLGSFCGGDVHQFINDAREDGHLAASLFRRVIVALGGLSALLVLVTARKNRRGPDEPQEREPQDREAGLAIGAGVFAVGLAFWVGTRGMAHDAARPLPMPEPNEFVCGCEDSNFCSGQRRDSFAEIPPASRCEGPLDAPEIDFKAERTVVDGNIVESPDELASVLKGKRDLYRQMMNKEAPGYLNVRAPSSRPTKELLPWLVVAKASGFHNMRIVVVRPEEHMATATLGDFSRDVRCCVTRLPLDSGKAILLTDYETWGEVAHAVANQETFRLER